MFAMIDFCLGYLSKNPTPNSQFPSHLSIFLRYMARGYRRRNKKKWRQQKLAVGTVQAIAKQVTRLEMQKQTEPKFSINVLGTPSPTVHQRALRCVILKTGLYKITLTPNAEYLQSNWQINLQHHPQTTPTFQIGAPAGSPIESGPRTRIGDSIDMTGLDVSGYITLGKDLSNAAVHIGLYKADQTLNSVTYLPKLNEMEIRRELDNTERPNKIVSRTFMLNHGAQNTTTRRKFRLYHRFKKPRRVKYNQGQTSDQVVNEARYQDDRYYLVMYSDVPDEVVAGGISPNQAASTYEALLDKNVSWQGRFTCYYRDS